MTAVHINIGNSDDKLSQARWAEFHAAVDRAVQQTGSYDGAAVHGMWVSPSASPWQNACWCLQLPDDPLATEALKTYLDRLRVEYEQESIAWTEGETEFIGAPSPVVHASPNCACGINEAGNEFVDPICRSA